MLNIHIEKKIQGSKNNKARELYQDHQFNKKYVVDYFSNLKYIIIKGLRK